jgi:membrane protein
MWKIVREAVDNFNADDGWALASHIALSSLIAVFPFLIFLTALSGFVGSRELANSAIELIFETWPETVASPISAEINNVLTQPRGGLLTVGAILALYFASSGVEALRTGLSRAYGLDETRSWWWLRIQSIGFVLVAASALLIYAFLLVLGPLSWEIFIRYFPAVEKIGWLVTIARFTVSLTALTIVLILVHRWLPVRRYTFREIAPGVAMTVVLSSAFGELFGAYLSRFATSYVSTYAGLGSVMAALAFLYTISAIFLMGGELNAAITRYREERRKKKEAVAKSAFAPEYVGSPADP